MQELLFGTGMRELVSGDDLQNCWERLINLIQLRPTAPGNICYFDHKSWGDDSQLAVRTQTSEMIGKLYVASQFGDHRSLIDMANGLQAPSIVWVEGNLDRDLRAVISSASRFRNHLSEHLSFWIRLAIEKKLRGIDYRPQKAQFTYSKPNIQPEDKGPDGLYIEVAPTYKIEIQSVKNSIGNPKSLISTSKFRSRGIATPKKLLDDLWLLFHQNDGLRRLEDLLDRTIMPLQADTTQQLRLALIKTSSCNSVVVADTHFAKEELFNGYHHVTPEIAKRIATYIGSTNWRELANGSNTIAKRILRNAGLL
jgi:hypothetical protein